MPNHIFNQVASAHLRTAFYKDPDEHILNNYLSQWQGIDGQVAWFRKVDQFDEKVTDQMEPLLATLQIPIKLLWGEYDTWLSPDTAKKAHQFIPNSELEFIKDAGHFSPEDNPDEIYRKLICFLNDLDIDNNLRWKL